MDKDHDFLISAACVPVVLLLIALFIGMIKTGVCAAHSITQDRPVFQKCMAAEIRKVEGGHTWSLDGD